MKSKESDAYSQVIDEDNNDNIFLYNSKHEPIEFEQIFNVSFDDRKFCILKPVVPMKKMKKDESLVYELVEKDGEGDFIYVEDTELIDKVFEFYYDELKKIIEEKGNENQVDDECVGTKEKENSMDKYKKLLLNSFYRLITSVIGWVVFFNQSFFEFLNIDFMWIGLIAFMIMTMPYWKYIFSFAAGNYKGALYSSVGWIKGDDFSVEIVQKEGQFSAIIVSIIMFFVALFVFTFLSLIMGIVSLVCFFVSLFAMCIITAKEATSNGIKALMIILAILLGLIILALIGLIIIDIVL